MCHEASGARLVAYRVIWSRAQSRSIAPHAARAILIRRSFGGLRYAHPPYTSYTGYNDTERIDR